MFQINMQSAHKNYNDIDTAVFGDSIHTGYNRPRSSWVMGKWNFQVDVTVKVESTATYTRSMKVQLVDHIPEYLL